MSGLRVPVLMFHHVEPEPARLEPPPLHPASYLARRELAALLDTLAARGYRTWTLAEAAARHTAGRRLPRRSLVLTFDDGCRCFRDQVWPELAARQMTATLFAVSGELGGSNRWDRPPAADPGSAAAAIERREELLGAAALRALAAAGIEIGAHGRHHRDLTRCDDPTLDDEVAGSRAELAAALGEPVLSFCFPYGRYDQRAIAAARGAGYRTAATIHGQRPAHGSDLYAVPRLAVNPGDSAFELRLKVSGAYPLWSRLPRLGLLRALRRSPPRPAPPTGRRPVSDEIDRRPASDQTGCGPLAGRGGGA
ncbi:MAG TPA: polysaccharide deacetylase family protein [Thermoanaerobaculia bacterium]|nr:polysaccharide deacetylase family protein [Thermoanaerobaculia bacterium]